MINSKIKSHFLYYFTTHKMSQYLNTYVSWYIPIYSYLHIILCNMFILNEFIFKWTLGLNMIFKVNFYLVKLFPERGLMMFFEWDRDLTSFKQFHSLLNNWLLYSSNIIYMFQCHSPKSSHPCPLPQSPKDGSIHLCLFCCLTYRVIVTIFLNPIYMC